MAVRRVLANSALGRANSIVLRVGPHNDEAGVGANDFNKQVAKVLDHMRSVEIGLCA